MIIKAVVFDIGGVLLRTEDQSGRRALERLYGLKEGEVDRLVFGSQSASSSTIGKEQESAVWDAVAERLALSPQALQAFKEAFMRAKPQLLEPIMAVHVTTPAEYAGTVNGNLSGKRGRIMGMDTNGDVQIIRAMVPLAEMFGYATELRTITSGRASFTMQFEHYEPVPTSIAEDIVEAKRDQQKHRGAA